MKSKHKRLDDLESKAGVGKGPKRTYVVEMTENETGGTIIRRYIIDWKPGDYKTVFRKPGEPEYSIFVDDLDIPPMKRL